MKNIYFKILLTAITVLSVFMLSSCSGGGGSAGATPGSNTPPPIDSAVADLIIALDKTQISNSGSQTIGVTVTALDVNRNGVNSANVIVAVDQGAIFSATSTGSTTDSSGKYTGTVGLGSSKSDRLVTVTVTSGLIVKTAAFQVTGSAISTTFIPSNPLPGQNVNATIKVTDSSGSGISGVVLTLNGIPGLPATVSTDATGVANISFAAPVAGTYNLSVTGSGVSPAPYTLTVSNGAGTVPNATISAALASASISINPTVIGTNTTGSTTNQAQIRAIFQSSANVGIQNMRVKFLIDGNPLFAGEAISTGSASVLSDLSGTALSSYVSGTRSSPTNGVTIKMCYSEADFVSASDCPFFKAATLTVAAAPLSVTIGDDNKLSRGAGDVSYIKKFALFVVDSAGRAVSDAPVSISVDIDQYATGSYDSSAPRKQIVNTSCPNEDLNRNGLLDNGEDKNNNGQLDPRKADITVSYQTPGITKTNANGVLLIQVEYPQNIATWISYTLKVSVNAAGSEGTAQRAFITNFILGDDTNGSFIRSPYGIGTCTSYIP
jgi:hypothetical protein